MARMRIFGMHPIVALMLGVVVFLFREQLVKAIKGLLEKFKSNNPSSTPAPASPVVETKS